MCGSDSSESPTDYYSPRSRCQPRTPKAVDNAASGDAASGFLHWRERPTMGLELHQAAATPARLGAELESRLVRTVLLA